jgi:hypothetical protein
MQYITIGEKMSIGMPSASMKVVQFTIHKCTTTWPKNFGKVSKHEIKLALNRLMLRKLNTPVKTR